MTNWHIITCECPPQVGGVSDYTALLARELRNAGDDVQVWAPAFDAKEEPDVHRTLGQFLAPDLKRTSEELDRHSAPRRLLVQWVPHGYGRRGVNLAFCSWVSARARQGDEFYLMVHEPYLEADQRTWKRRAISLLQRRMVHTLLYSARRVFISIPAWENYLRRYAPPAMKFERLPIPATIGSNHDPRAIPSIRARFGENALVLGHLGTYSADLCRVLQPALLQVLAGNPNDYALLMGSNSDRFARELKSQAPDLDDRIYGTGLLANRALSHRLAACDLALQPYPDGLSFRRTSLMNLISHGVAVVSNTGHLTESLWSDSAAVALATTTEASQLSSLCLKLLGDREGRQRLAQSGRALYQSRFDWPNVVATLRSSPDDAHLTTSNQSAASVTLE
jgi:glycosyltransferase involved in cell wall biosynthesis